VLLYIDVKVCCTCSEWPYIDCPRLQPRVTQSEQTIITQLPCRRGTALPFICPILSIIHTDVQCCIHSALYAASVRRTAWVRGWGQGGSPPGLCPPPWRCGAKRCEAAPDPNPGGARAKPMFFKSEKKELLRLVTCTAQVSEPRMHPTLPPQFLAQDRNAALYHTVKLQR
jgi:hypothetical protein